MTEPRVLNIREQTLPLDAVYVGRPSKWGNPFKVDSNCSQEEAVRKHRQWIDEQIERGFVGWGRYYNCNLEELQGKDLVCWCSPLPCHGDILLELANK